MTEYVPVYPSKDDPLFTEKLAMMEDFGIYKIPPQPTIESAEEFKKTAEQLCKFEKTYYQHFVSQYISRRSPYQSLLLYHGLGSGKTCSAITIAETFLKQHRMYEEPTIWVVSQKALEKSFEQEIFRTLLLATPEFIREQCTGDSYYEMIPDHDKLTSKKLLKRIHKIIKSRYKFFGYDKFANVIEETDIETIKNKVIIIDEAHNIRNTARTQVKKIIKPLVDFIKHSQNNKIVLLSATPMFNEAEEILWLTGLLMMNDKLNPPFDILNIPSFYDDNNKPKPEMFKIMKTLSSQYISYIRGSNPFTFAVRIKPELLKVPVLQTVPKLTFQGTEIAKSEHNWLDSIKDGIVPSVLSGFQLKYLNELQAIEYADEEEEKQQGIARLSQINNITYIKKLTKTKTEFVEGKDGLFSVFKKTENGDQLEYLNPKEPILDPAFGKLKDYSTKFHTIYELLQKSKGLVVIYSNFVWGGIVPLSIMLEHMGLSRLGKVDTLNMRKKVTKRAPLDGSTYCILSGENEKDVMGTTKIDDLLASINNPEKNQDIKVVLMSPVASEGLTFKAVREIHILDAWYHLNTAEQAIGRAIRHCSHSSLPIEERNVSVFLHATVFPDNKRETEDLHAYRLSAIKHYQIMSVDKVIKENAIDCTLMKNVNYFPKELFNFTTVLKTSHGTSLVYKYGENDEVKCVNDEKVPHERRAFRKETYDGFIPTLQLKLQKYLKNNFIENDVSEYVYDELLPIIHPNKEVAHQTLEESIYPYKLWGNYSLLYHYNRFIITEFKKDTLRPTRIQIEQELPKEKTEPVNKASAFLKLIEKFANESREVATLKLYTSIDSDIWKDFARKIVTDKDISPKIALCIDIFEKNGSFIKNTELPKLAVPEHNYIGYLNIFSNETGLEGFVWENNTFRELLPSEILKLKKERTHTPMPDPLKEVIKTTEAIIQRYKNRKSPDSPYIFKLKLLLNNETEKRTGIVCDEGMKKHEILKELGDENAKGKIPQLCFKLMHTLLQNKKLWIPVSYK